jgi:hypothetical protein
MQLIDEDVGAIPIPNLHLCLKFSHSKRRTIMADKGKRFKTGLNQIQMMIDL